MLTQLIEKRLRATFWTVVSQASLSMGFPRQEYWSGLPFLSPGDLPDSGIEPGSPALQEDSLPSKPHLGQVPILKLWQAGWDIPCLPLELDCGSGVGKD